MQLAQSAIREAIRNREIVIRNYKPKNIGPGSLDVRIGDVFRCYRGATPGRDFEVLDKRGQKVNLKQLKVESPFTPIRLSDDFDYRNHTIEFKIPRGGSLVLLPNGSVLGQTMEHIELRGKISGRVHSRSKFARAFLQTTATAPILHQGTSGTTVLELINSNICPLKLKPGDPIAQFTFERVEGEGRHTGKLSHQNKV